MHKRKNDLIPYTCGRCQPNVNAAPDKSKDNTEPLSREFYKNKLANYDVKQILLTLKNMNCS